MQSKTCKITAREMAKRRPGFGFHGNVHFTGVTIFIFTGVTMIKKFFLQFQKREALYL